METFEGQVYELVRDEELEWWQASIRNESGQMSLTTTELEIKETLEESMNSGRSVTVTYREGSESPIITSATLSAD
ncbi:MAG TPA: hypothetical protein VF666_10995 [Pyrinomonadaceae bacterium]|jgi:hypothetical protein